MEEQQIYDEKAARAYILEKFREQGDFLIFGDETLEKMLDSVMAADNAFMQESGALEGEVYDDDAAFDFMFEAVQKAFPEHKMYMMRLVEDYMDYNERYLDEIGAIAWD